MTKLAIFASGSGSNAKRIMEYFSNSDAIEVGLVVTNRSKAGVLEKATLFGIPSEIVTKYALSNEAEVIHLLRKYKIDYLILAGFLLKVPNYLIEAFPKRIINIHPSLLPKFGGKGMYGHHVHAAVKAASEVKTGMTIHYVNAVYDQGEIIDQFEVQLNPEDSVESIAGKVLQLEHLYFAPTIESIILEERNQS